jgi:hypothetical protein
MYVPHCLEASDALEVAFIGGRAVEARDRVFAAYTNWLAKKQRAARCTYHQELEQR